MSTPLVNAKLPAKGATTSSSRHLSTSWVPVRSLVPRHRERIATHLKSLDPSDRYLRFGYATNDEQIDRYVAALDFDRDEVFGIFNRRLALIAVAHVAYASEPQLPGQPAMVEFGVSVAKKARGRGYGKHLFKQAMLHARNRGIDTLFIYALSENAAMIHIARAEGARVERDGPDSQAWLKLPPGSLGSQLDEMLGRQAAELQYGLRRQARKLDGLIDVVEEVKGRMKSPASE